MNVCVIKIIYASFCYKFGIADIVVQILLLILLSKVHNIHPTIRLDFDENLFYLFVIKILPSNYNNSLCLLYFFLWIGCISSRLK